MKKLLSLLFGLERKVSRRVYLTAGFSLMTLKLGVDLTILYVATGSLFTPWQYLSLASLDPEVPMWAVRALMVWALPFAWIGLSMTVRRALDAGLSPWLGLVFCLPVLNFVVMAALCFLPTRRWDPELEIVPPHPLPWLTAIGASLLIAVAMVLLGIFGLEDLGIVLFAGTPLGMGLAAGFVFNRGRERSAGATLGVAAAGLVTAAALLLLFAVEGVFCLLMALPLAFPLVIVGALVGRGVAMLQVADVPSPLVLLLLVLPLAAWIEPEMRSPRLHTTTTRVEIAAPPAAVWRELVAFTPLPPPRELWFRLGIAYPTRARIEGHGVGAVRYCVFSTGTFVEPITVWDEPRHLAFDVAEQPEPLRELSPYPDVHLDHLKGSLRSRQGEFRLTPTADGGTLLEGTTWYELSLFPESYWSLWTGGLIRSIHTRVLHHIKRQAES